MTIKLDIGKKGIRKAWDSEKMTKLRCIKICTSLRCF